MLWLEKHQWTIAVLIVAAGVALAIAVPKLGTHVRWRSPVSFDAGTAQATLAAIAGGMMTLTGFVFTAVTLVIQTVQSQSPRLLRAIDRSDRTPLVFGVFAATFTYALVVLSRVRDKFVPSGAVDLAIVLVLVCVGLFFRLLVTVRTRLTSGGLVRNVGDQLREAFDELYPEVVVVRGVNATDTRSRPVSTDIHHRGGPGVLQSLNETALVNWAAANDALLDVVPVVGDFVATGAVLARVRSSDHPEVDELGRFFKIGAVRTLEQDAAYGFRLLVDIAIRALSPAVNDPTTAVQTLDQLDDLLQRLAQRPLGAALIYDASEQPRVHVPGPTWESFVGLALDEIRLFGAGSIQVTRRLRALLVDLLAVAPPGRHAPVQQRLDALLISNERQFPDADDRRRANQADHQGLGAPA